MLGGSFLV
jgi:hypothetical protein